MARAASAAVQLRMRELRMHLHPTVHDLSAQLGHPIPMRCAWAGTRYVGRCLYNLDDAQTIYAVHIDEMLMLLRVGIVGALQHRMKNH